MGRKPKYQNLQLWKVHKQTDIQDEEITLLIIDVIKHKASKYFIRGIKWNIHSDKPLYSRSTGYLYDSWVDNTMMIEKLSEKPVDFIKEVLEYGKLRGNPNWIEKIVEGEE